VPFDILHLRHDFPVLDQTVHGKPLIYFDNAATTQKPRQVIDRIVAYLKKENCNIHRGVHLLSQQATEAFENARKTVQQFINAEHVHEVVFTKGATESINMVASSLGRMLLKEGDEILLTGMEHHSNVVPWQFVAKEKGAHIRVIPVDEQGELDLSNIRQLINEKTRIVAITHVSNVLGTINPVHRIINLAHERGIPVLLDGAQAAPHLKVDVKDLDCEFYAFSSHKIYGPMGVGVLYGKEDLLNAMPPYQGGGEMIDKVTFDETTFTELPLKFEAGTPNVSGVLGLEAAINYLMDLDLKSVHAYENELLDYITLELMKLKDVKIYGLSEHKTCLVSFMLDGIHPYDAGTIYDKMGIAVRTGHQCAQPLMDLYEIPGTIRASLAFYNTIEEIDHFIEGTKQVIKMLG
jgi:cysteine desulfurase/selenocysteine lyase